MPAAPHPADVHAGDYAEVIASRISEAFDAVVQAVAALELRPTAVEVHRQLGLTSVSVYFPARDVDAVDTLAGRFRLPFAARPVTPGPVFYTRTGVTEFGAGTGSLTVRTVAPGVELPDPLAAAAVVVDEGPAVITGELAPVRELPAAASRGELVVP